MKVRIDPELCGGCGPCEDVCPEVFEMDEDEGLARVKVADVPTEHEGAVREAVEDCPAEAIIIDEG